LVKGDRVDKQKHIKIFEYQPLFPPDMPDGFEGNEHPFKNYAENRGRKQKESAVAERSSTIFA